MLTIENYRGKKKTFFISLLQIYSITYACYISIFEDEFRDKLQLALF